MTDWYKDPKILKQTARALDMSPRDFLKHLESEELKAQEFKLETARKMRPVYRRMIESGLEIEHLVDDDPLLLKTYLNEKKKWEATNLSKGNPSVKTFRQPLENI